MGQGISAPENGGLGSTKELGESSPVWYSDGMEMIERAARILCERDGEDPDAQCDGPGGEVWVNWFAYADRASAVISALREPTGAMCAAAAMADVPWEYADAATGETVTGPFALELSGPDKLQRAAGVAGAMYRAMIDAALTEPA
jgi:hypothetical protein